MRTVDKFFVVWSELRPPQIHGNQADAMADAQRKAALWSRAAVFVLKPVGGYVMRDPQPEQIHVRGEEPQPVEQIEPL